MDAFAVAKTGGRHSMLLWWCSVTKPPALSNNGGRGIKVNNLMIQKAKCAYRKDMWLIRTAKMPTKCQAVRVIEQIRLSSSLMYVILIILFYGEQTFSMKRWALNPVPLTVWQSLHKMCVAPRTSALSSVRADLELIIPFRLKSLNDDPRLGRVSSPVINVVISQSIHHLKHDENHPLAKRSTPKTSPKFDISKRLT